jgi:hypothetical protein
MLLIDLLKSENGKKCWRQKYFAFKEYYYSTIFFVCLLASDSLYYFIVKWVFSLSSVIIADKTNERKQ